MISCKFADTCAAPLCPLTQNMKTITWFSSDDVCHRKFMDSTLLVRNQKLLKKHNVPGYFTLEMLTAAKLSPRSGISPDVPDDKDSQKIYKKREREWMRSISSVDKGVNNIKIIEEENVKWIYLGQTGLNEFITQNRDIPFRTLSQCADELSKYYGVPRDVFYNKKTVKIKEHALKVLKIPYENLGIDSYGGGGYHSGGSDSSGGKQKGNRWLPLVTSSVTFHDVVNFMLQKEKVTSKPKKAYTGYFFKHKKISDALHESGYPVTFLDLDNCKYSNIQGFYLIKKGNQIGNHRLPFKENHEKKIQKSSNINDSQPVTFYFSSTKEFGREYFSDIAAHADIFQNGKEFLYSISNPSIESKKWVSFALSSHKISERHFKSLSRPSADLSKCLPGTIIDIVKSSNLPEEEVIPMLTQLVIDGKVTEKNGIYEVK